jgi:hypothetical protein
MGSPGFCWPASSPPHRANSSSARQLPQQKQGHEDAAQCGMAVTLLRYHPEHVPSVETGCLCRETRTLCDPHERLPNREVDSGGAMAAEDGIKRAVLQFRRARLPFFFMI